MAFKKSTVLPLILIMVAGSAWAELPEARIFAPGMISGPANDGAPTFTPDGQTLYFERSNGAWSTILESHLKEGRWSRPALASFIDHWSSQQPALSPDGRILIFESSRPDATLGKPHNSAHLYRIERTIRGWSVPVELPPTVNISRRVFKPTIASNGDLYFMADTSHGASGPPKWRLYVSRWAEGNYAQAQPLAFSDGQHSDVDPYIAPDQSYLIFSSQGRLPFQDGHEHLFIVHRTKEGWSPPTALRYKGDESGADDGEAQVGPDRRTLYFTSGRSVPIAPDRTRREMIDDLARLDAWDNSNGNVWMMPLPEGNG